MRPSSCRTCAASSSPPSLLSHESPDRNPDLAECAVSDNTGVADDRRCALSGFPVLFLGGRPAMTAVWASGLRRRCYWRQPALSRNEVRPCRQFTPIWSFRSTIGAWNVEAIKVGSFPFHLDLCCTKSLWCRTRCTRSPRLKNTC